MGLKNGVWQQLSEETGEGKAKQAAAGHGEGWSLHPIIKYVWTFYYFCTIICVWPA
jgi:hypothetical protein